MTADSTARWRFDTRLVHEGEHLPIEGVRSTSMPIYATSTFIHPSAADLDRASDENGMVLGCYGYPKLYGLE